MSTNPTVNRKPERNDPVQPGLDPTTTGTPRQSDPRTDPKPGQPKKPGDPDYRPGQ